LNIQPTDIRVLSVSFANLQPFFPSYRLALSESETAKADRYRFDIHRIKYVCGRGFLRHCLANFTQQSVSAIELSEADNGKPFLASIAHPANSLQFNVSHSDTHYIVAFAAANAPLGIDIEAYEPNSDLLALAHSQFSMTEQQGVINASDNTELLTQCFFNIWTRKEAVIKAHGGGLSIPLASFDTSPEPNSTHALMASRFPQLSHSAWRLLDLPIVNGHAGALCCAPSTTSIHCQNVLKIESVTDQQTLQLDAMHAWSFPPSPVMQTL